ncbi:MAG: hypothetical protein ABL955_15160, partial [Elusimicrobiota bacterium]
LCDRENHASIIDGCRLSFADVRKWKHNDMADLDTRLPLVLYNFAATGDWRGDLPKRLMKTYPAAQPVALLAGSGDREFSPLDMTLGTMEAALRRADEAVTILIPAVAS